MISGNCIVPTRQDINSVLAQTPTGKIAMFKVVSIPSKVEDRFLGEAVYVKRGKVFDFMADREIVGLKGEDLLFVDYVQQ